jgi:hypothetical protein
MKEEEEKWRNKPDIFKGKSLGSAGENTDTLADKLAYYNLHNKTNDGFSENPALRQLGSVSAENENS